MAFRYRSHQINDIAAAPKVVREGQALAFTPYKVHSLTLSLDVDLQDGALINLRLIVSAGQPDAPDSYHAALLLDDTRIRGVDYQLLARKRWYRIAIPPGWHQNLIDPNLSGDDANRHEPLPDLRPTDLDDFLRQIAALWHIDLRTEPKLL